MTDPTQEGQPTEEEIKAYLGQIREADPAAIIVQAYQMLGEGAQIKLGRSDARVLIDAMAGLADAVESGLPAELAGQMKQGVAQLQAAQVQAEQQGGQDATTPQAGQPAAEPSAPGQPQAPAPGSQGQPGAGGEEKLTDRLWVPGKGPNPGV